MKKGLLIIISFLSIFLFTNNAYAASGSYSVTAGSKTVIVGNTVKVTVKVSSSDLGAWEYCISYDSKILKLTNSTANANTCVKARYVSSKGQKSSTETFTFKAIKSGSTNVTVKSAAIYSYSDENQMPITKGSVTIKTMTQAELEATYSTNANLKSLSVDGYKITPSFDKKTKDYSLEVENEVESVKIHASVEDSKSSLSGTGEKSLVEGSNKFRIIVTAQKGNDQTYTLTVYRKELNPISVTVSGVEYNIVRKKDELLNVETFDETEITYENETIPALKSEITGYTLVGLKDDAGSIKMYIYDNGDFKPYIELKSTSKILLPDELEEDDEFSIYKKTKIDYNGLEIEAYKLNENSKQAIIYAQDIESAEYNYYLIDVDDYGVVLYNNDVKKYFIKQINNYKYVIYGLIGFSLVELLIIFIRKPKKKD